MPLLPAPRTAREDVVDDVHGAKVIDPYRWLEADSTDRVREWTDQQNARTRAVLDPLPQRAAFARRLRELLSVGLLSTPRPIGGRIFHARREGEQKQAVLYVRDAIGRPDRALIDPNALDRDGLVTLDWYYPSPDARFVAYGLSRGGDEMSMLHVVETATGKDLADRIPHTQRSTVAWIDGGFFYTVHPAPGTVAPGDENYYRRVRYHRLGDDPAKDKLVFGEGRPKEDILGVSASDDGRWILLSAFKGWARSDLYLLDRDHPERGLATVIEGEDALSEGFVLDGRIWLRTNLGAPNYRVVSVACESPDASRWETVVAEGKDVIEGFDRTRDRVAVLRLVRATSRLATYDLRGKDEREIALPSLGGVETGGLFALPNLRGGGEYGESWHRAGMLADKQNVFDDFHSAAEALIATGWTEPKHLAITGGSNGGLLVGAALTQRPDLFAAVVCKVPLADMLRYHKFRIGALWIPEYGSPDDPQAARWLAAYSPYQHVRDGVAYPAVF